MQQLIKNYELRKEEIVKRLRGFSKSNVFEELCFCLLTPQSKAKRCDVAIQELGEGLRTLGVKEVAEVLKGRCRFHNNKAGYIVEARNKELVFDRDWLVRNVKGLGLKEASHFLRNVGRGHGLAILDRHVLKNLKKYGVIKELPETLTHKKYLEVEGKMKVFSEKIGVPMHHLDLLFWSMETGEVLK
ncbi:MAG: N-glycosylase/DNA lyase [Nanoarchaeota archaeon]|nr:N-glycosylase/DNA lyase [Nanoarchaeota archaeon]